MLLILAYYNLNRLCQPGDFLMNNTFRKLSVTLVTAAAVLSAVPAVSAQAIPDLLRRLKDEEAHPAPLRLVA